MGRKIKHLLLSFTILLILSACQAADSALTNTSTTKTSASTPTIYPLKTRSASATRRINPDPTNTPMPRSTKDPNNRAILMAVGDIMLGRTIGDLILEECIQAPFADTYETLASADLTLGNLECPISTLGAPEEKTYTFRAPLAAGESLAFAGFDLVSLANNHSLDYGSAALNETIETLALNGIQAVGAGMSESQAYAPVFREINGIRLALLAFVDIAPTDYDYTAWEAKGDQPGVAWAHPEKVRESVRAAKNNADVVIVLLHNGYEIVQRVSRSQQETAQLAIESGASLVIGSHPHVLQRIEAYQDGLIVYSMGNFVFDNFLFPPNYSAILVVTLSAEGVESYELIDVIIQLNGVPQIKSYH